MTRINVYLPDQMLADLRLIAEAKGVPVAELIRRAIDEFLQQRGN